jgi:hypothetical protein
MRALLLLLAGLHVCIAVAANAIPPWQEMQRAVLVDRNLTEVEVYLKAGFDPRTPIGCGTFDALDGAVQIQDPDMVALLLRYGARPKESTFVAAASITSPDSAVRIVAAFLQSGSDVNSKMRYSENQAWYWTALDHAVWRQNVELVRLLVSQKGVSINDVDGDGYTALEIARAKGNGPIEELLLQAGADPSVTGSRKLNAAVASAAH